MTFAQLIDNYIERLGCSSSDLSKASGLSAATISRYRSGDRIPARGSRQLESVIAGITRLYKECTLSVEYISEEQIRKDFEKAIRTDNDDFDYYGFRYNFNLLINRLGISMNELARAIHYDTSYVSRIHSGQRKPSKAYEFIESVAGYVADRYSGEYAAPVIADMIGLKNGDINEPDEMKARLTEWLFHDTTSPRKYVEEYIRKLDAFNIEDYVEDNYISEDLTGTSYDSENVTYYGIENMDKAVIPFTHNELQSEKPHRIYICGNMFNGDYTNFIKYIAILMGKGFEICTVNCKDSVDETIIWMENWMPLFMTGQIEAYYLNNDANSIIRWLLMTSENTSLEADCVYGCYDDGRIHLTSNGKEVGYYYKRAVDIKNGASKVFDMIKSDRGEDRKNFLNSYADKPGVRMSLLSTPPIYTISDELLYSILERNNIEDDDRDRIVYYIHEERERVIRELAHSEMQVVIPEISIDKYNESPVFLSLSGLFYEKDIFYTYEEYCRHMDLAKQFEKDHQGYSLVLKKNMTFRNIQIFVNKGKWVMISKNKTPAIHFIVTHSGIRMNLEKMTEMMAM